MYILKLLSWKHKEVGVNSDLVLDINGVVLQKKKKKACFLMTLFQKLLLGNQQQP